MLVVHFFLSLLAGAMVCNSIPHLAAGLRGEMFPSPFTVPRGSGPSSPELNVIWGSINLFIGLFLFHHPVWFGFIPGFVGFGWFLGKKFGQLRAAGFQKP